MARTPLAFSRILLVLLLVANFYRAATTSISTDEAYTYLRSVSVPIPDLWKTFDANDHVLHTLLCKVSVSWFGVSEFSLRIPALLGGFLLLSICLRLCRLLFGDTWLMLLGFALLVLNPLILDYCSVARGYGMAVALWLVSLDQLLRITSKPTQLWRLSVAGVALALGACANLTVVIPGIATTAAFAAFYLGPAVRERNWLRFGVRADAMLDRMIVPGIVIATGILLVPLLPAKREHFYLGASSWKDSLIGLGYACLWRPMNLLEHTPLHKTVMAMVEFVALALPPCILVMSVHRLWRIRDSMRALLTMTSLTTFAVLFFLNAVLGMRLPERRTGLYLVPLLTLLAVVVIESGGWLRKAGHVVAALTLAQFLVCWNVSYYDEWQFDSGSRDLAEYLRDHAPQDPGTVTVHATFPLSHSVEFYRLLFGLEWLQVSKELEAKKLFDVFLLSPEELPLVQKYNLQERYVQPGSNITIATAPSSPLRP